MTPEETTVVIDQLREEINSDTSVLPSLERLRQSGPFTDKDHFVNSSLKDFSNLLRMTEMTPDSAVLDYGCGLGRLCVPFRPYLSAEGNYVGIDTDREATDYLTDLHGEHGFAFHHVNVFSQMYNRKGKPIKKALRKAKLDNQADLAFLFSVFTHVLPDDVPPLLKYLSENVKKGGQIFATFFILNEASKRGIEKGNSHRPFPFPYQNARIDNSEIPEGAVAYEEDDLRSYFADAGLEVEEMSFGNWSGHRNSWHWQDNVVLKV